MLDDNTQRSKRRPASRLVDVLEEGHVWGTLVMDNQHSTAWLSVEAETILGLQPGSFQGQSVDSLPGPVGGLLRELAKSDTRQPERRFQWTSEARGNTWLCLRVIGHHSALKTTGTPFVLSDLTATRHLERHWEKLNRLAAIGTLSASMAHEIKNALVAGKTFIDLLLEKHEDEELVEIVRRELGRIDALVSETLRFAKQTKPHFGTLRLHDVLARSLRLIQPQLETKSISVESSFQTVPDLVNGDEHQLQQAFVNLLLNAAEAMGPHGKLTLNTENAPPRSEDSGGKESGEPAQIRVTVKDTGGGIPPETLSHLFEPFFTTKATGTGLGLPITWRIIHEHRGTITVDSQVGIGTSFFILLPALPAST